MTLIPQGYYRARAVRVRNDYGEQVWAKFGRAKKGTQQVVMMFEIIDHDEHSGTRAPWFGFFTKNAWERTIESLRYCGFQGDDLDALNSQQLDQVVSVKLEHETSKSSGRTFLRVAFVNAASAGNVALADPMSANEVRDFAAMMKSRIANTSGGNQATTSRDPLDDIPF